MRQINLRNVQDAETITKQYMLSVSTESMLVEAGNSKLKDVFGMPLLVTDLFIFSFIGFFSLMSVNSFSSSVHYLYSILVSSQPLKFDFLRLSRWLLCHMIRGKLFVVMYM